MKETENIPNKFKINVIVLDSKGNEKNKLFIKSLDYNNKNNKSDLKKLENETSKILQRR